MDFSNANLTKLLPGIWRPFMFYLLMTVVTISGCSVYMAAKQPGEKNLTILKPGTHRSLVIAELGTPVWSGEKEGNRTDVFVFKEGYSTAARTARALFHGTADVFTLGLWEVVSTPTEAYFSGTDVKWEVVYDSKEIVRSSKSLTATPGDIDTKPSDLDPKPDTSLENQSGQ